MMSESLRTLLTEQDDLKRRQRALHTLATTRQRRLRESLDTRIARARRSGEWHNLSRDECQLLHDQEKAMAQDQLARLERETVRGRTLLANIRKAKARLRRQRAARLAHARKAV